MWLRFGEINGRRPGDIDLVRHRIRIDRARTQDRHSEWHLGLPKHGKRRTVPIPAFLVPILEEEMKGKAPEARLILRREGRGRPLPYPGKAKGWREAAGWNVASKPGACPG